MKLTAVPQPVLTASLFRRLYEQHAGELCGYLTRSLRGDSAEAEGITQEAFLKAWEKRSDLKDTQSFRSWIFTIGINILRQRKRKLRPLAMEVAEPQCERPSPEQHASDRQELDQVRQALDNLPEDQRESVMLVRLQGLKFREAAEILGIPENTVKTRVRRALIALADELGL